MTPVRWALWGCGGMAQAFVTDLLATDGNVVHSVASRTPERARQFASSLKDAKVHSSLASLLDDAEVDIVYVSTPPSSHFNDSLAVLSAGKGLLCEKPLALNGEQARTIVDTARRQKVFCMEAMWMLCIPAVREAQRLINDGAIGVPHFLTANFSYLERGDRLARLADPQQGGGALLDRGVYPLHLAAALCGPATVAGAVLPTHGAESQFSCLLQHDSGVQSQLVASFLATGSNSAEITGEAGVLQLQTPFFKAQRLTISPRRGIPGVDIEMTKAPQFNRTSALRRVRRRFKPWMDALRTRAHVLSFPGNGYQFEIQEAADCIRKGRTESSIVPLQRTLDVMTLVDGVRSAAAQRAP
jgi:predicted dehydrogenase